MKNMIRIILVIISVSWAGTALAYPDSFYAGIALGRTDFEDDDRFADLGEFRGGQTTTEFSFSTLTAVVYLPIERMPATVFGKAGLGVIAWDETGPSTDDSGATATLGFGVAYTPLKPLTLRIGIDVYAFTMEEYTISGSSITKGEYVQSLGISSLGMLYNQKFAGAEPWLDSLDLFAGRQLNMG